MKFTMPRRTTRQTICSVQFGVLLIALVCSGCSRGSRFATQVPERVMAALEIEKGDLIADIGCGSGGFAFHLADTTGPEGKVYAIDVNENLKSVIEKKARDGGYEKVKLRG